MPDPTIHDRASADARAKSDSDLGDSELARNDGSTPEQVAARQRVVRSYLSIHCPNWPQSKIDAFLKNVNTALPVQIVNRKIDMAVPGAPTLIRYQFLDSERFSPVQTDDPQISLRFASTTGDSPKDSDDDDDEPSRKRPVFKPPTSGAPVARSGGAAR